MTASADCPEAFGGACDLAIGAFGWETSTLDGSRRVIMSDWQRQRREHGQECWAYLFDTGIVDKAEAEAWADVVWSDPDERLFIKAAAVFGLRISRRFTV